MIDRLKLPLVLICALAVTAAAAPTASAARPFAKRFGTVASGKIIYAANTLVTCDAASEGSFCTNARNDTSAPTSGNTALNNNNHQAVAVDVDSDPLTKASSTANLALPADATVLFAGLYWSSNAPPGLTETGAKQAKLRGPADSAYRSIVATSYDSTPGPDYGYVCFLDVTSTVSTQGGGAWTFGSAATVTTGTNRSAGWSLVVVYGQPGQPVRSLSVFDGQQVVGQNTTVSIPITGFQTPATGPVRSNVGFIALDGDRGISGDSLQLNSTILTDSFHPLNNSFNSWITTLGVSNSGRNPSYGNQLGWDASIIKSDGVLGNNVTSANIQAKTSGDGYMPLVFTFATELYAPDIALAKTVTDVNGGEVRQGDELEYVLTATNSGGDGATDAEIHEAGMPDGTEYVAGSLAYDPGTGYSAVTDAAGDDVGEASGGSGPLTVRVGAGAGATKGGLIANGKVYRIKFRVKVTDLPPPGSKIANIGDIDFATQTLGAPLNVESNKAEIGVNAPDAAIAKKVSSADFSNGLAAQYTITVKNEGNAAFDGETVVTDDLPVPSAFASATVSSAVGWSCSPSSSATQIVCKRSDTLAPGGSYPPIVLNTTAVTLANGGSAVNNATVSTPYDVNPDNDKASVESQVGPGFAAIPVTDSPDVAEVLPGDPVVFTGTFYNTGPSVSTSPQYKLETDGITTDDVDVIGFVVRASDGTSLTVADCTMTAAAGDPVVVTCNRASLPVGVQVEIDLTLSPKATTKKTEIKTKATSSATNDPGGPRSITATAAIPATADLELTKTATSDLVDTDGSVLVDTNKTVTYTVRVVNNGPRDSGTVRITDEVPAGLTPESAKWNLDGGPTDQDCTIAGQSIDCPGIGSIAPTGDPGPQFAELTVVARADKGGSGLRTNTANVEATAVDPAGDNNSASAEVELLPTADLQIKKSGPPEITSGSRGSFTLVALNNGPSEMTDVVVTDTLPSGIEFRPGAALPSGCKASGSKLTCTLKNSANPVKAGGVLKDGESWTLKFAVQAKGKAQSSVVNRASVTASNIAIDQIPGNNSDAILLRIAAKPALSVALKSPRRSVPIGKRIKLLVKVKAPSRHTVKAVTLCVNLPSNVKYRSSTGKRSGSRVCWKVGTLNAGKARTFTIDGIAKSSGRRQATAVARGSGTDRATDRGSVAVHSFTG
ncbi:MAG: DUF11 domain-containing protein [Actinomycetes bacterium]